MTRKRRSQQLSPAPGVNTSSLRRVTAYFGLWLLGIAGGVIGTFASHRLTEPAADVVPDLLILAEDFWVGGPRYYFPNSIDAGQLNVNVPQTGNSAAPNPNREPPPEPLDTYLAGLGGQPAIRDTKLTVFNPQAQGITIIAMYSRVTRRVATPADTLVSADFGQGGGSRVLEFSLDTNYAPAVFKCGAAAKDDCAVPADVDARQRRESFFAARNVTIAPTTPPRSS